LGATRAFAGPARAFFVLSFSDREGMSDYLNLLVPPLRERRPKPCIAYGGMLCGIGQLA
jgi:hypothetical protein